MKPQPARRIVLAPTGSLDADAAEASLVALAEAPPDGVLRIGSALTVAGTRFVVHGVDPSGAVRLAPETEVRLEFAAPSTPNEVWDVAILVDHGAGMRGALPIARAGVERFLANAGDTVRHVSLLGYAREPFRLLPLKPLAQARVTAYDGLLARGPANVADGLDAALAEVARGESGNRRAVILLTRASAARGADAPHLIDAGLRAKRLGVQLHAWDLAEAVTPGLEDAVRSTGGTLTRGPASLRTALTAMAEAVGSPLEWREAPPAGSEVEFEIVVRAIPAEPPDSLKVPRRRKKK